MKKTFKQFLSVFISVLMMLSVVTPAFNGASAVSGTDDSAVLAESYKTNLDLGDGAMLSSVPSLKGISGLCRGAISGLAHRSMQELISLTIQKGVPGLSTFLVLIQDPASRAELQHKQLVKKMAESLKAIYASIEKIADQLQDLSDKIDKYQSANALKSAITNLYSVSAKYQAAWVDYQAVCDAGEKLAELEDLFAKQEATEKQVEDAKKVLESATIKFINRMEEGGGFSFLSDIDVIPGLLWNPADATSDYDISYLGAYESYLRDRYPFEHQITMLLADAVETSIDIQLQMLVLYSAYYGYKQAQEPDNAQYAKYTDEYFTDIQYSIIENSVAMVESTGFGTFLLPDKLSNLKTEEEIKEIYEIDPNYTEPENINTVVKIAGTAYDAYKVRSNKDLSYYIIPKRTFTGKDIVTAYKCTEAGGAYPSQLIYAPELVRQGRYSDDNLYTMVSDKAQLDFDMTGDNLLAHLRDINGSNLGELSQDTSHILLYSYDFKGNGSTKSVKTWNVNFQNVLNLKENTFTVTAENVYTSGTQKAMVIYKSIPNTAEYKQDGIYYINDKGKLDNRTIIVSDGQTLDISQVTLDCSGVTIIINGSGKVIANPGMKLTDSRVIVNGTDASDVVTISNLNIVTGRLDDAALNVKTPCTVKFEGNSTFKGLSDAAYVNYDETMLWKLYTTKHLFSAIQGILTNGNVKLEGVGDAAVTATGSCGGSGVCFENGNLTIENLNLTANGSSYKFSSSQTILIFGSGIGASVSCTVTWKMDTGIIDKKIHYVLTSRPILTRGDAAKNGAGSLNVINSNITATSRWDSDSNNIVTSQDIGGINLKDVGYYAMKNGAINSSTVNATASRISDRITTKGNGNKYLNETFTVSTYTKGSNGVTTDGVQFRLHGELGESEWINASETGNSKGDYTRTVHGSSVGKIDYIEVKTNSDNHWYPGKITVEGQYSGQAITVYGGRWIGNSAKKLSPSDNVYEVTVKTGTDNNAGTDSAIFLRLKDSSGKSTNEIELSDIHQDKNAFEKGDTDTFPIYAPDGFGECCYTYFRSDYSNPLAGWQLESFTVKKVQGAGTDNGYTFTSGQWFEEARTINFGKYSGGTGAFHVSIKTSGDNKSGTDSDVWLTVYGETDDKNTGKILLGTYNPSSNDFEKGNTDSFYIGYDVQGIGNIDKIVIEKNDDGAGPDWKVESVKITEEVADGQSAQSVTFTINKFIGEGTYTYDSSYISRREATKQVVANRSFISSLVKNDDGTYTLPVDHDLMFKQEAFEILAERDAVLTVEMKNDEGETIYAVTFDGSKIDDTHHTVELKKSYSLTQDNAIINFIADVSLPEGTTVKLNTEFLGIGAEDSFVVLTRDENSEWAKELGALYENGFITLDVSRGKQILINKNGAALPGTEPELDGDEGLCEDCNKDHSNILSAIFCLLNDLIDLLIKMFKIA